MFGFLKNLMKKPEHTSKEAAGLGYKTDGRGTRGSVGRGKQRMLLDSTKLMLDTAADEKTSPYEAEKRVDDNVYQMFNDGSSG